MKIRNAQRTGMFMGNHKGQRVGKIGGAALRRPASVRLMSEIERAWVGAMVEADGCISREKAHPRWDIRVANGNLEVISALLRATGVGNVYLAYYMRFGERHSWGWTWQVTRQNDVVALAAQIEHYCTKAQKLKEEP